ncbi:SAM-dependent methyltransferase [Actinomadura atramentaria]|uniref:SAM-dependent methyltransferase n=1 Tax=Actinomadura atramentaria TaxID=1990 RepID=UPI00036DEB74|nr:SAM-dependent methyltransferase [Actinomadura atramentaria]
MRISVLGDLTLRDDDGRPVNLGERGRPRRQLRALLCVLAVEDRPLPAAALRALLWDDDRDRASLLTNLVAQARRVLPAGRLATETGPGGGRAYRLRRLPGDETDAEEFERAAARADTAREKGLLASAAVHYRTALARWDGIEPGAELRDLPDTPGTRHRRDALLARRAHAAEASVAVRLDLGRHGPGLLDEIEAHLARDPANEDLHRHRLVALYRLGRRADALRAYRRAAAVLAAELDAPPGLALRRVRDRIAADDPGLLRPPPGPPHPPRLLPGREIGYRGVTDYLLGGKDNTARERAFVDRLVAETGTDATALPAENRECVLRMVTAMARRGVRQFLDLGSGLPDPVRPGVHDAARRAAAEPPLVVYVDNDPVVAVTSRAMVAGDGVVFLELDLRDVEAVLDAASRRLDFAEPIGLIVANTLQYVGGLDADLGTGEVVKIMEGYAGALPAGSLLALTHITGEGMDPRLRPVVDSVEPAAPLPQHLRDARQIERLFAGLPLLPPGLADVGAWRPERPPVARSMRILAGLAVK